MSYSPVKDAWKRVVNHLLVGIVVLASIPLGAPGFVSNLGLVEKGVEESLEWAAPQERVAEALQPVVEGAIVEETASPDQARPEAPAAADTGDLTFRERARLATERAQAVAVGAVAATRERAVATGQAARELATGAMDATTGVADDLAYRTQEIAYNAALVTTKALAKFIVWALTFLGLLGWGVLELRFAITSFFAAIATTAVAGVSAIRGA